MALKKERIYEFIIEIWYINLKIICIYRYLIYDFNKINSFDFKKVGGFFKYS